jgi:hypothetical protein
LHGLPIYIDNSNYPSSIAGIAGVGHQNRLVGCSQANDIVKNAKVPKKNG